MPRHALDKWTYSLKTMDVCITQHREDDVYNHMVKMYAKAEELYTKFKSIYDKILKEDLDTDNNIYTRYDWRKGEPSRFWNNDDNVNSWYSIDLSDDDREVAQGEYGLLFRIYSDFSICDKHGEDWLSEKPDWKDMVCEITGIHNFMKHSYETIKLYEKMAHHEAKQRWMLKDREWIEEQGRKKEHRKHPIIEMPSTTDRFVTPEPYPEAPLRDDCIYCKQHWEEMKPKYEKCVLLWTREKEDWEEYEAKKQLESAKSRQERERKAKEYEEFIRKQDPVALHCDHCDFEAEDEFDLEEHNKTEEHKQKSRFCKICDLQCRNDADYKYHLETTKHKKNAGLINKAPTVYKCSKCDYESKIKCNYERHMMLKHSE